MSIRCHICNKPVDKIEWRDDPFAQRRMVRATCHGATAEFSIKNSEIFRLFALHGGNDHKLTQEVTKLLESHTNMVFRTMAAAPAAEITHIWIDELTETTEVIQSGTPKPKPRTFIPALALPTPPPA